MPNLDPKQLKKMMDRMGIKSTEVDALRVVIEGRDLNIIIDNPQVIAIDAQGSRSFQISGDAREESKEAAVEINDDDVKTVVEQTGVDEQAARAALEQSNGDIAAAILRLKEQQ